MLAAIRAAYGEEQPVADIENQLGGCSEQKESLGGALKMPTTLSIDG